MASKRGNNEGSIFKRKDGRWCAQVSLNGRRITKYGKTQKECRDWVNATLANLTMLNNALAKTGWSGPRLTPESWRTILHAHLMEISWKQALTDVEPFLLSQQESSLLTRENLDRLLGGGR